MTQDFRLLTLNTQDNIAVALADIPAGEIDESTGVTVLQSVTQGHKIAIAAIGAGQNVIRYGQTIGQATADIAVGEHVHVHGDNDRNDGGHAVKGGVEEVGVVITEGAIAPGFGTRVG